jgi:hypothetical protein
MIFLKFFIGFLALGLVYVMYRTIKLATTESPNFPVEEEEEHLFAERPFSPEREIIELEMKETKKASQKDVVIAHLMVHGTISKAEAKSMGIFRLPMIILRLRKLYKIDNVIVDGKFAHYKLIEYKGK